MPVPKGYKHTPETCKIYSESKMGEKNPNWGTHHTEEWKQNMGKLLKGRPKSEETIKRMKEAHKNDKGRPKGYKHTKEARENMSKGRKGMKFSEEHRKHLSEAHMGQVVTEEGKKKRSEYNKAHPEIVERLRIKRANNPTKPQIKLLENVKSHYPDYQVEPEWRVDTKDGIKFIDVAIPELKIGFEWDSQFWHRDNEKDQLRHNVIEAEGWKLIRYSNILDLKK